MKLNVQILSATLLIVSAPVFAVEAVPRGNIQVQASYFDPEAVDDARWSVAMPNTSIGITAVEQLSSSNLIAHLQFGLDPLSSNSEAVFEQQDAYLNWNQGVVSIWAGRLPTLETAFLEDLYKGAYSLPSKGLFVASNYQSLENKAVRLDVASGEYLVFSGQWFLDEAQSDSEWSTAAALKTPEGSISVVYRQPVSGDAIWGNLISWEGQTSSVSLVWMLQNEVLAWDIEGRAKVQSFETFLSYGSDQNENQQYVAGIQQSLSASVTNFSELSWQPDTDIWQWSTGFNVAF